jgi:hypothetical protein
MKSLYFGLVTLLLTSCYNVERNCSNFQVGKFESTIVIDDVAYKSTFIRTKDLQIETFDGKTDSSTVRWINDCEVVFKTIHPKRMADQKDIHLKILETTDSSYTFEYSYIGEVKKQRGTAKLIR